MEISTIILLHMLEEKHPFRRRIFQKTLKKDILIEEFCGIASNVILLFLKENSMADDSGQY